MLRRVALCCCIGLACGSTLRGTRSVDSLLAALAADSGRLGVVFDIGANNGKWTSWVMERATRRGVERRLTPVIMEPHPRFAQRLAVLAHRVNGTFYQAAASARHADNVTFFSSRVKEASSLVAGMALAHTNAQMRTNQFKPLTVSARDLSQVIAHHIGGGAREQKPLALLKIDVEAAEYDVLPRLLLTGVACELHALIVEWHLSIAQQRSIA
jgi:FkbM family methyltransferase